MGVFFFLLTLCFCLGLLIGQAEGFQGLGIGLGCVSGVLVITLYYWFQYGYCSQANGCSNEFQEESPTIVEDNISASADTKSQNDDTDSCRTIVVWAINGPRPPKYSGWFDKETCKQSNRQEYYR